jgi:hypothetical protein
MEITGLPRRSRCCYRLRALARKNRYTSRLIVINRAPVIITVPTHGAEVHNINGSKKK